MINEDAPTMSAGNGGFSGSAAATGPVAGFDPILGDNKKPKKRKFKRKDIKEEDVPRGPGGNPIRIKDKIKAAKGQIPNKIKEDAADRYGKSNYLPFLVSYDGAEQYVLYGKSPAEIKIQLRKIYRPENHNKIRVKRLYPNEVIQWYWKKRQRALTDQ
tara:strand:+ start:153 stop:626 length:474 start_codon:yes stop_codon:yes gene_type:complete